MNVELVREDCAYRAGLASARAYLELDELAAANDSNILDRNFRNFGVILVALFRCAAAGDNFLEAKAEKPINKREAYDNMYMVITHMQDAGMKEPAYTLFKWALDLKLVDPISKEVLHSESFGIIGWRNFVSKLKHWYDACTKLAENRFEHVRKYMPTNEWCKTVGSPTEEFNTLLRIGEQLLNKENKDESFRINMRNIHRGLIKEAYNNPKEFSEYAEKFCVRQKYCGQTSLLAKIRNESKRFFKMTKVIMRTTSLYAMATRDTPGAAAWLAEPRMLELAADEMPDWAWPEAVTDRESSEEEEPAA